MKTVGIITFYFINYGAVLQAYALQETLSDMGFAPEIIDYRDESLFGVITLAPFSAARRLKYLVWHRVAKNIIAGGERQRRMENFCQTRLRLSPASYRDMKILHSSPPFYDIFVAGSDQVWNPNTVSRDPSYLLTFAPSGNRLVSYGASFGVSQIDDKYADAYIEPLKRFEFLSVRESEGRDIIKRLTGRDAEVVLDPTLLLDREQWRQIAVPYEFSRPYILCYYMQGDKEVNKGITALARRISSITGWAIICIGQKEYMRLNPWRRSIFDAGPAEYLGLFQNASFVVTNSFHGTTFAVNYGKPFYALVNQDISPERALSSRITTLLRKLKLEHRLLSAGKVFLSKDALDMDYRPVEAVLREEKQRSIDFLKNALGGA